MIAEIHPIAKHGEIRWVAESPEAGPYHLMSDYLNIAASFGTRGLMSHRPGSIGQEQAFRISKAAFYAIRELEPEIIQQHGRRAVIKAATKAARAEYSKWSDTFGRLPQHFGEYFNRYLIAVSVRLDAELTKQPARV